MIKLEYILKKAIVILFSCLFILTLQVNGGSLMDETNSEKYLINILTDLTWEASVSPEIIYPGEQVTLTLKIKNNGTNSYILDFGTDGTEAFEFKIRNVFGNIIEKANSIKTWGVSRCGELNIKSKTTIKKQIILNQWLSLLITNGHYKIECEINLIPVVLEKRLNITNNIKLFCDLQISSTTEYRKKFIIKLNDIYSKIINENSDWHDKYYFAQILAFSQAPEAFDYKFAIAKNTKLDISLRRIIINTFNKKKTVKSAEVLIELYKDKYNPPLIISDLKSAIYGLTKTKNPAIKKVIAEFIEEQKVSKQTINTNTKSKTENSIPKKTTYFDYIKNLKNKSQVEKNNSWINVITGKTDIKNCNKRTAAVMHLNYKKLSQKNIDTLYKFLDSYFTNQTDLSLLEFNAIKNDLFNHLTGREPHNFTIGIGKKMLGNYNNVQQDTVWRSYCLQHLERYYSNKSWCAKFKDPETREKMANEDNLIRQSLWNAAKGTNSTLAGTALKILERLSQNHSEFDKQKIAALAFEIVENKEANVELKTTAVSVCGKLNKKEVLPFAKHFAEKSSHLPLRSTSISVIGKLGSQTDINFLKKFNESENIPIRTAAQTAIQNIEK